MILSSEQIQAIIDGAPEGFTVYRNSRLYKKEPKGWLSVKLDGTGKTNKLMPNSGNIHHLSDLREILTLRQRVQELESQVPKWISVEDEMPKPETPVLAIVDGYDGILTLERRWERCNPMIETYYEDFLYWDWVDNDGQDFEGLVQCWMPLPQPPKGEGDE